MNSMPASTLVFGFCVILLSIAAPLVKSVGYGQAKGNSPDYRLNLCKKRAANVQRPGSSYVVVCHGLIGLGGWQYAAVGLALQ